jgi:hypothetical protein
MKSAVMALVLVVAGGCKNGPSEDQCKQLMDHLVDLEFKKGGANAPAGDAAKQEQAKTKAEITSRRGADFITMCTKSMTRSRVTCALAASDMNGENGIGKCDEAK